MTTGSVVVMLVDHAFPFLADDGFKRFTFRAGMAVQVTGEQKGGGLELQRERTATWVGRAKVRLATKEETEDFHLSGAAPDPKRKPVKVAQPPVSVDQSALTAPITPGPSEAAQIESSREAFGQMDLLAPLEAA